MKTPRIYTNIAIFYGWEPEDETIDAIVDALVEVGTKVVGWSPNYEEGDEDSPAINLLTEGLVPDGAELYVDSKDLVRGRDWALITELDEDDLSEDERAELGLDD